MMAMIKLINKTANTIIIVAILSPLVLRPSISSLFSKKYDIENKISGMGSSIDNFLRQHINGYIFKKCLYLNYEKAQITGSYYKNRKVAY